VSEDCRSCKRPVRWVRMVKTNKAMPLDPEPHAMGNIQIVSVKPDMAEVVPVHSSEPLFISHFATCPFAATHRKPTP
jgi:hypothetical protein